MALTLAGGTVLRSLHPPRLARADVTVEDGRVREVGPAAGGPASGGTVRDCSGCLIVPGNVCAHTHVYSALARGMPYRLDPPANFIQILQRIWWRLDRALDEGSIRASALVAGMEALLAGTTTLVDHHASPHAIDGSLSVLAGALGEVGIRSVLCYEVTDRDGPQRAAAGIEENRRFLQERWPLSRGMVGAHASFTLSPETLAGCVEVARGAGAGIHVHVAEDAADQRDARARFGTRVVHRLAEAGAITPQAVLAHCVHLDPSEVALVTEVGATVAHNPTSNMNNSVGHASVGALGERVALGTDGIGADMFAESRTAYFRARDDDVFLGMDRPLRWLAQGSGLAGRAFGEPALGTIDPGAPADLVVLAYREPTPLEEGNVAGHWLFGAGARHVRDVVVAGELVVADGRLTRVDQDRIAEEAAREAARLWARMEDIPPHPFTPAGEG